jgi:hypothetical protein
MSAMDASLQAAIQQLVEERLNCYEKLDVLRYTHTHIHSYPHTIIHSYTHTLIHSYPHTLIRSISRLARREEATLLLHERMKMDVNGCFNKEDLGHLNDHGAHLLDTSRVTDVQDAQSPSAFYRQWVVEFSERFGAGASAGASGDSKAKRGTKRTASGENVCVQSSGGAGKCAKGSKGTKGGKDAEAAEAAEAEAEVEAAEAEAEVGADVVCIYRYASVKLTCKYSESAATLTRKLVTMSITAYNDPASPAVTLVNLQVGFYITPTYTPKNYYTPTYYIHLPIIYRLPCGDTGEPSGMT